jgi:hypothetical protein
MNHPDAMRKNLHAARRNPAVDKTATGASGTKV